MKIGLIIGTLIILVGASIIMNAFHIHFPIVRAAIGLFFGWVGLSLVLSSVGIEARWMAFRPHGTHLKPFAGEGVEEMNVVFAQNPIDLSGARPGDKVKLSVIFGDATVRYDPTIPLELKTTTAFGDTRFDDGVHIAFGARTYRTPACSSDRPCASVEIATVFGSTKLVPTQSLPRMPGEREVMTPAEQQ